MKLLREEFQELSEISLFNSIGTLAENKGYDVVYFKTVFKSSNPDIQEYKYVHYIHLMHEYELKFSIYFDTDGLLSPYVDCPYYEFFDLCDTERFYDTTEDKHSLIMRIREAI